MSLSFHWEVQWCKHVAIFPNTPDDVELDPGSNLVSHKSGSLLSNVSLIAGTTIGAGILALPAATLPAGLLPSTLLMVGVWLYMAVAGLLVAEANLYAMKQLERQDVGLLATIQFQLGRGGAIAAGFLYAFIHYSLLVAYAARGGDILSSGSRESSVSARDGSTCFVMVGPHRFCCFLWLSCCVWEGTVCGPTQQRASEHCYYLLFWIISFYLSTN